MENAAPGKPAVNQDAQPVAAESVHLDGRYIDLHQIGNLDLSFMGVEILSSSASTYRKSIALPEEASSRRASGEGYAKQALC